MGKPSNDRREAGTARLPVLIVTAALISSLALVALDRLFLPERFTIKEVIVKGDAPSVDPAKVLHAIRKLGPRSWFSVDLADVESVVSAVPWVYRTTVRRRWPGKLIVTVSQAQPVARWNDTAWINTRGELLTLPREYAGQGLPRLFGDEGNGAALIGQFDHLSQMLSTVDGIIPTALGQDKRGALTLSIQVKKADGAQTTAITIGREHIDERMSRLIAALKGELRNQLTQVSRLDLRYPNGFAVRFVEGDDEYDHVVESADKAGMPRDTG